MYLCDAQLPVADCYRETKIFVTDNFPEYLPFMVSERTFRRQTEKIYPAIVKFFRYGEKTCIDDCLPYIERLYDGIESNDVWVADNHTLDFITRTDNGNKTHRLYVTGIMDAKTGVLVGWNITETPNSHSTVMALRHAIQRCGIPKILYVDNGREFLTWDIGGKGHRTHKKQADVERPPTILDLLGIEMRNAIPENGRAKPIERMFLTLKNTISRLVATFTGGNIIERPESLKYQLKHGYIPYDWQIREQLDILFDGQYNAAPYGGYERQFKGMSRAEAWCKSIQRRTLRMCDESTLNLLLMRHTGYQKVRENGVYITISGEKLWYNCGEENWKWVDRKVYVRYDPAELECVRVYDEDDTYIGSWQMDLSIFVDYITSNKDDIAARQRLIARQLRSIKECGAELTGGLKIDALVLAVTEAQRNLDKVKFTPPKRIEPVIVNKNLFIFATENEDFNSAREVFAERLNSIRIQKAEIETEMNKYQQTIDDFEGMFVKQTLGEKDYKSSAQMNAEEYARNYLGLPNDYTGLFEAVANNVAETQEENTEKLKAGWESLNHAYAMGVIASEEELYAQKSALLEKYGSENLSEHWKYYEELYDYQQEFSENSQKAAEEAAEAERSAIESEWNRISNLANLGVISAEDAYRQQLEWIQKYCPEYADEWQSYYKTIADYQREALSEQVSGVKDSLSKTISEYKSAYAELESSVNSYKNRLLSVGDTFSLEEKDGNKYYNAENQRKQIEQMKKYHNYVMQAKANGASDDVIGELTSYDFDDGMFFAENLAKMSESELKEISELQAEKKKLAEDLANELYAPEMEQLNSDLVNSVIAEFGTLPEEIREVGAAALEAFIAGLSETEDLTESVSDFTDSFFAACNDGIANGIAGLNLTDSIMAAFSEQDTYAIGKEKGDALVDGFNDALSGLYTQFEAEQSEIAAAAASRNQYQLGSNNAGSTKTERIVVENHNDVTVELDGDVVGKKSYTYIKEYERQANE